MISNDLYWIDMIHQKMPVLMSAFLVDEPLL